MSHYRLKIIICPDSVFLNSYSLSSNLLICRVNPAVWLFYFSYRMFEPRKKPIKYLDVWCEARGVLIRVNAEKGELVFKDFRILLLPTDRDTLTQLESHVGKRVSVLRMDISDKPILYIRAPS